MTTFTAEDADRLLQLADQFLEDWEDDDGKDEFSAAECKQRRKEWDAIRPLLVAAPRLLAVLQLIDNEECRRKAPTLSLEDDDILVTFFTGTTLRLLRTVVNQATGGAS
jgi:hypothetical protein